MDKSPNVSGKSNTVTATTPPPDGIAPSASVLLVPDVSPSQVWLSWTESVDNLPSSSVGYSAFVNGEPATGLNWINRREASLRHLSPGTTYSFKVTARDGSGNTTDSNTVSGPLAVAVGVGSSFVSGTVNGPNTFVVKAVDRSGNTSGAGNSTTIELWTC